MQLLPVSSAAPPPFKLSSPPWEAFEHPSWRRAEETALAAAARGELVLVLGQPGTGKTFLLQRLERTLRSRGQAVRHVRHGDPLSDVPPDDVLLIDEAGALLPQELGRVCRLPNACVMVGLPSLRDRLASCPRAARSVTLERLAPEEVARFVVTRLTASGRSRDLFTPEAVLALSRHSQGLLRLVVILAGASLFFAEQRGAPQVTDRDVEEAAAMRAAVAEEGFSAGAEERSSAGAKERSSAGAEELVEEASRVAAPLVEPAWTPPAAVRGWSWPGALVRARAGLAGVGCASLVIVTLAVAAALGVGIMPPLQIVQDRTVPVLASAVPPGVEAAPLPVQVAAAPAPEVDPAPAPVPAGSPPPLQAVPSRPAPPDAVDRAGSVLAFSGPIMNDTMGQGGRLSLQLRTDGSGRPVGAWFHASNGLIGTGPLSGEMGPDGRIRLSGRLMMGRNPFDCALRATLEGDRLVGEATFVRATSGATAHSSFALSRL